MVYLFQRILSRLQSFPIPSFPFLSPPIPLPFPSNPLPPWSFFISHQKVPSLDNFDFLPKGSFHGHFSFPPQKDPLL